MSGKNLITIGIRAKPDAVTFAVFDSASNSILNVETVKIPKALSDPEALRFVRNSVLDILREYRINRAGIRAIEPSSQQMSIRRIEIEGVIKESFSSSDVEAYFCGHISNISARVGFDRAMFKDYVAGTTSFERVENWSKHNKEEREAILVALGAVDD